MKLAVNAMLTVAVLHILPVLLSSPVVRAISAHILAIVVSVVAIV